MLSKALLDNIDNIGNVDNLDNLLQTLHLQREPTNPARIHCLYGEAKNYGIFFVHEGSKISIFSFLSHPKDSERPSWTEF